jgi:6-phosphofructokinase 1
MAIRQIGIMTSGGDAPGMNAATRAAVRMAGYLGMETLGIQDGYAGLLEGRVAPISPERVEGIERLGGTILGTSRSAEFRTPEGLGKCLRRLREAGVEALLVIGGEGSLKGAYRLHQEGFPVVGVPASIDNDVGGTTMAIGVDTAINTALDAIDRLKDTASAFHRAFIVEVMGRSSGWIALQSAIAAGADMVLVPEVPFQPDEVVAHMQRHRDRGASYFIVVAAEGISPNASELFARIERADTGYDARLTILGHIQRGGSPTAFDRLLAARLSARAVNEIAEGRFGTMVGLGHQQTEAVPLETVVQQSGPFSMETYRFAEILARQVPRHQH